MHLQIGLDVLSYIQPLCVYRCHEGAVPLPKKGEGRAF